MSAAMTSPAQGQAEITGRATSFATLLHVETRKLVDTRAGRWLIGLTLLASALVVAGDVAWSGASSFGALLFTGAIPLTILLPVVAILAATAEFSQRTALTTFALEPRRLRVAVAKTLGALLLGAATLAATGLFAAVGTLVVGTTRGQADWNANTLQVVGSVILLALSMVQGIAFGLVMRHSAAAIVAYFVLPSAFSILGLMERLRDVLRWLDYSQSTAAVSAWAQGVEVPGQSWAQFASSATLWVLLPLLVGLLMWQRREAK